MRTSWHWLAVSAILGSALCGDAARAGTLYGLNSTGFPIPGTLYSINTTTGAATAQTTLTGTVVSPAFTDVAVLNGTFYASDMYNAAHNSSDLVSFDPTTGATTDLNNQGGAFNWHGLAADPNAGVLYAVDSGNANFQSYNPTTQTVSLLGNVGTTPIDDLTYDPNGNVLYGISQAGKFYSINTSTGALTLLGNTGLLPSGLSFELFGLAYDPTTGTFYVTATMCAGGGPPTELYSFTLATVNKPTNIGALGANSVDGLVFVPSAVPEPASATLLGIALGGLAALRLCRSRAAIA